jgi:hypothetical protein
MSLFSKAIHQQLLNNDPLFEVVKIAIFYTYHP